MAALTMTPTRQPFASLDSPRMHNIMRSNLNRQNQQNGALTTKPSIFADADTENINPSTLNFSTKRKRTFEDDDVAKGSPKPLKTSRMALGTRDINVSPRLSTPKKTAPSTPKSAPILKPAGRTPPPKSCKPSGRRSTITKSRPKPSKRGVTRPFSLATALSQNKPIQPPTKTPASWSFEIHVDTEQEEMTNLMEHSTGVLDISDDESKSSPSDGRGKENVPPSELGIELPRSEQSVSQTATAATRTASKMEEDRAPLGELNASDYYPEECNAFSYVVVYDDESENALESKKAVSTPTESASIPPKTTSTVSLETSLLPSPAESSNINDTAGSADCPSAAEKTALDTEE